jgi:2,3-dihydroxy-2,3-dihydro-p-cumate dehydrogenase
VRVGIVTGGASGIGRGIAARLLADDWNVVVADLNGGVNCVAVTALGGDRVLVSTGDLSSYEAACDAVRVATDAWGRLDLLVNNAGGGVIAPFMEHDDATIELTITRNLVTTINCCRAAIPVLREHRGRIVNIGAESVRNGLAMHAMYNAAKGGVHGLTTGLARELAPDGITVNCVAPSIVVTDAVADMLDHRDGLEPRWRAMLEQAIALIPSGRPATVEEVAATVSFLASSDASFITGQVISVNGGSSML